jgi:hypothetical protein
VGGKGGMKSNEARYFQTMLASAENIDAELRGWALAQTFCEYLPTVSVGEQAEIPVFIQPQKCPQTLLCYNKPPPSGGAP